MDKAAAELRRQVLDWGGSLYGVADLGPLRGIATEPVRLLDEFSRGISVAVRLSNPIIDGLDLEPAPIYAHHYQTVNSFLDHLALKITNWLQEKGCRAMPIPASQIVSEERLTGAISHRTVAMAAGLGWYGKSQLLITPEFGPRLRWATGLTDMPLTAGTMVQNRCGKCRACVEICPVQAIKDHRPEDRPLPRERAIDVRRCDEHLWDFDRRGLDRVCGLCIKACPWGKRAEKNSAAV
jgi:epoxyqueuosine reductase